MSRWCQHFGTQGPQSRPCSCSPIITSLAVLAFFAQVGPAAPPKARADILHGLATMGDSSSIKSQPYKFPVMMQTYRGLNFGGTNLPYVRAVGGATSASMLTQMQPEKVAADVAAGKVTVTTVLVGNNDYGQNALNLLAGGLTEAELANFENMIITNIETAVTTVLDSGIEGVLLGSVPRLLDEPAAAQYIPLVPPEVLELVDASQERVNAALLDYANAHHIPFVDFFGFEQSLGTADHITVGGVPISLTKGPDATYFFVDNLHPGWVGNAILSNFWMTALNVAYDTHLNMFSDQEALAMAQLPGYTGETFTPNVDYASFIHYNPPLPSQLAVASLESSSVLNFNSQGTGSTLADGSDGLLTPFDAAYDANNNLYVSDVLHSRITKFDASGVGTTFADASSGAVLPASIAFGPDGYLYATNYLTNTLVKFDPNGVATTVADAAAGLNSPFGVAVDPHGNVFVANLNAHQILEIDPTGHTSVFADASDGLFTPIDVVTDSAGNVYVADVLTSKVYKFTPDGVGSIYANAADGLTTPSGLAFDTSGNLYVTNYLTDKIIRIDASGFGSLFADSGDGLNSPFGVAFHQDAALMASLLAGKTTSVPEPATWVLLLCGATAVAWARRR